MRKSQLIVHTERKWLLPFFASSLISILLLAAVLTRSGASTRSNEPRKFVFESRSMDGMPAAPRLAYLITGSKGDGERIRRLLHAIYHPRNQYLLHLDREAPDEQRLNLGFYIQSVPLFSAAGNVNVIGKADFVSYMGPTALASTLHGAAIFLRYAKDWDWFINLSALDYPLITQDDLLHVFSYLPRDLNFIHHTSDIGQKEYHTVKPIVIDTGLFSSRKSEVFYATQRRMMPNAFKHFTAYHEGVRRNWDLVLGSAHLDATVAQLAQVSVDEQEAAVLHDMDKASGTAVGSNEVEVEPNVDLDSYEDNEDEFGY